MEQYTPINERSKHIGLLLITAFLLGVIFDVLFYSKIPGISWLIFTAAILVGLAILTRRWGRPMTRAQLWIIIPMLLMAMMVAIRSSAELTFMNIVVSGFLLLMLVAQLTCQRIWDFRLTEYIRIVFLPFAFVPKFFDTLSDAFTIRMGIRQPGVRATIKGVLMAVPILALFTLLFSSADLVFKKYLADVFRFNISPDVIYQTGLVFFITAVLIGAFGYIMKTKEKDVVVAAPKKHVGPTELHVMLGLVNGLFLAFIIIQVRYLFGGHAAIINAGFTYAEYARRGFFELIVVAMVAFGLLWAIEQSIEKPNGKLPTVFIFLGLLLNAQVLVVMASAFQRMNLYEQAYGFTLMRWYSHALILWLTLMYGWFSMKIVRQYSEPVFLRVALGMSILFLLGVNMMNPDNFVARQNLHHFTVTGKIDPYYLTQLSSDAVPVLLTGIQNENPVVRGILAKHLFFVRQDLHAAMSSQWPSLNYSRNRAVHALDQERAMLAQYKEYTVPDSYDIRQTLAQ